MKVGELVELSAAGQKLQYLVHYREKLGIVLENMPLTDNLYIGFIRSDGRQIKRVLSRRAFRKAKGNK